MPTHGGSAQIEGARTRERVARRVVAVALLVLAMSTMPVVTGQYEVHASPVTVEEEVGVPLPAPDEVGEAAAGAVDAAASVAETAVDTAVDDTAVDDTAVDDTGELGDHFDEELQAAELPSGAVRAEAVEAPMTFSMLGFELPDGVDELYVRTSADGEEWSDWVATERVEAIDGPDPDTDEAEQARAHAFAEPVWAEEANYFQVELPDGVEDLAGDLRAELIDSVGYNDQDIERRVVGEPADQADAASAPNVISRAQWGADESWAGSPSRADSVSMGVVHHTATSNSYSDASAVMRSMYHYHTQSLGWKDLGYNIVIDRAGNLYEGRKGGLDSGVIGAHAAGFNTGSFGVSVIGNYTSANPTQASLQALEDVIAWQSSLYGIDPSGTTSHPDGTSRATIVGHRQVGQTACPGRIQGELDGIRARAAERTIPYADVQNVHRDAVLALVEDGVINGCGDGNRFCPGDGLTRGQMAALMARALGLDGSNSSQHFSDVPTSGYPHSGAINALVEAGVVEGWPDGTFRPQQHVQRDQMATFIANGFDLRPGIYRGQFDDVARGNPHARAVEAAAREDIARGCGDGAGYCPQDTLRRDQAASLLHRALYR